MEAKMENEDKRKTKMEDEDPDRSRRWKNKNIHGWLKLGWWQRQDENGIKNVRLRWNIKTEDDDGRLRWNMKILRWKMKILRWKMKTENKDEKQWCKKMT